MLISLIIKLLHTTPVTTHHSSLYENVIVLGELRLQAFDGEKPCRPRQVRGRGPQLRWPSGQLSCGKD